MLETVTIPSSSTAFVPHNFDYVIPPTVAKATANLASSSFKRDMLSASMPSRRPNAGRLPPKVDLSERVVMSPTTGTRWRLNGTGQLVDSTAAEWDLANEIVKLQIGGNGDGGDGQMRTPPQSKAAAAAVVQLHETSPLETASEASLDSNSTSALDQPSNPSSHSRGSSADTTGSALSSASQTLRPSPFTPVKLGAVGESRNRPHSYSGGLSATDLTRLQQAGGSPASNGDSWTSPNGTPERQPQGDQPTYPTLTSGGARLEQQQPITPLGPARADDFQVEYHTQQRQFSPLSQTAVTVSSGAQAPYVAGRANNVAANMPYRQPPRAYNPPVQVPPVIQSPNSFAYAAPLHPASLPLNNAQQQLYDMMLPTPPLENPAMARLQQQHGIFRGAHQHSSSDPISLRDPAALAMVQQGFVQSQMYGGPPLPQAATLSMFANQFYGAPQEAYPSPELAVQMMRLQAQFSGPYPVTVPGQAAVPAAAAVPPAAQMGAAGNGPSANNRKLGLYKTELCRSWEEKGTCRYGAKCQFAHGEEELRKVSRHPKYKTEICRTFWVSGSCPYGKRCCFIHTELPASGAPPGADGAPPPANPDGRARSSSTNSDPNEVSSSLLARISAKRSQEGMISSGSGSVSTTPPSSGYQVNGRPGSLRVDTSVLDSATSVKQNKSAYPTFAHNGILLPAGEEVTARSPGPVTAGPDFGRHASARIDIVGSQQRRMSKNSSTTPNVRHSFNGSDMQLDFSSTTPTATNVPSQLGNSPPETAKAATRMNGHVRSGSAGNWGSTTRSTHLTAYPLSSIPSGELGTNSPWAEYAANNRLAEKNWA